MKKFTLLFFALFLTSLYVSADTYADFSVDDIYYKITNPSELEVAVTYHRYDSYRYEFNTYYKGDIVVPETVKYGTRTFKVTSIGDHAFYNCSNLKTVTLPEGLKTINLLAFSGCTNLASVLLPSTLETIAQSAFDGCKSLENLILPEGLKNIGRLAFQGCSSIQAIVVPDNVTLIDAFAFSNCYSLKSIVLPRSLEEFGEDVLYGTDSLAKIICRAEIPPTTNSKQTFSTLKYTMIDLIVPKGSLDAYKKADFWKNFMFMFEDEGENKCATPTVTFVDGKLSFACETAGAEFHYTIKCEDAISGSTTETTLPITGKYTVSVYATADGYGQSDTVTETIELKNGSGKKGDVTEDGKVDVADINAIVDIILGN